jgi:signal transduction histidine kinase
MKPWQSVSTRLTLTLLSITLGSLIGFFLVLDAALMRFFIRDAQAGLTQQATALANHTLTVWNNPPQIRQLVNLSSQQGRGQVIIIDAHGKPRIICRGIEDPDAIVLPSDSIAKTLAGDFQTGELQVPTNPAYSSWLYSTAPIRNTQGQIVGAVFVVMPLRRPQQFANQVEGVVMGVAIVATTLAAIAGWLISRSLIHPLRILQQQAQRLETGDYLARSGLTGQGELAQLSCLLDQMADKLTQTLTALQAQETARRELVANVSHDLRTPLASLRVGIEAILDGVVTGDKAQTYLQRACHETDHLSHLVEQLLLLSKADAGQLKIQPQVVSVVAIAQECLSRMQPSANKVGVELKLCAEQNLPAVQVDPALTGQIILNLLDNAIKYACDGKLVCLNILNPVENNQKQFVPLQVQDYGQGMETDVVQRVTDRFYRGSNARPRGGMGLGLAIAHQVCQLQNGSLQIQSEMNQGTVITLLLPIAITSSYSSQF